MPERRPTTTTTKHPSDKQDDDGKVKSCKTDPSEKNEGTHRHSEELLQERTAGTTKDDDHTGFFSDAFRKEVAPKGTILDAIVAGLRGF